jgi:hypothetical protein
MWKITSLNFFIALYNVCFIVHVSSVTFDCFRTQIHGTAISDPGNLPMAYRLFIDSSKDNPFLLLFFFGVPYAFGLWLSIYKPAVFSPLSLLFINLIFFTIISYFGTLASIFFQIEYFRKPTERFFTDFSG